jgi:hypothetical protein
MGNKRAQLTLFVIVAIIIVVGIAGYFIISNQTNLLERSAPAHIQPIQTNIENCLEESVEESLFLIGLQGGKTNVSSNYLETTNSKVLFAFKQTQKTFLTKQQLEQEISSYVKNKIGSCLSEIKTNYPTYEITTSEIKPTTKIEDKKVLISLSVPIIVSREDSSYKLDKDYKIEQKLRLGNLHILTTEIIEQLAEDSSSIDLTYLTEQEYNIFITDYSEGRFLYSFTDLNNTLVGEPYIWRFAVQI